MSRCLSTGLGAALDSAAAVARPLVRYWLALVVLASGVAVVSGQAVQPGSPRTLVIVSDLHMGEGRLASGAWHPQEDFRWAAEFGRFLETIDSEGRSAVDLVLNGDTFELLQSTAGRC